MLKLICNDDILYSVISDLNIDFVALISFYIIALVWSFDIDAHASLYLFLLIHLLVAYCMQKQIKNSPNIRFYLTFSYSFQFTICCLIIINLLFSFLVIIKMLIDLDF